ncbi:hypothetical protein GCM10022198_22510 [Klugiella xanthotipulae]|uniref:3-hydroxyacyl-CoA dehydrogenase n=1 Tax=Klugiella xanthotipulae TaxID=244735 RepID=A0A543HYD9_9MICO|nr:Rv3235 family protein [Klugiella xanthotipulae]TQM63351.1 hypothetical protein FB466_1612 [Klugiella xanthotipulae]
MISAREHTDNRTRPEPATRGPATRGPETRPDTHPPRRSHSEATTTGTAVVTAAHLTAAPTDPKSLMESLALSAMEIVNGGRDLEKIARWLTESAYASLRLRRSISQQSRQAVGTASRREPMYCGRTRTCSPRHGVIEGVTMVHTRLRTRAVIIRLEKHGNRWIASQLSVL